MKTDWPYEFPGINWLGKEEERAVLDVVRKGACPKSDELFARSILLTIPSRLTQAQEKEMAEAIRSA